jgi:RNA polymerase sigma-70 factor (ECF subfamily)
MPLDTDWRSTPDSVIQGRTLDESAWRIRASATDVEMDTNPPRHSDGDLMQEVVAGSQEALALLYDRHVDGVFAAARRLAADRQLAEEVVQETFLTLWNRAELYDSTRGSLTTWLRRIARNRALDRLRAAARRPRLLSAGTIAGEDEPMDAALERLALSAVDDSAEPADPGDAAVASWTRQRVRQAIGEMPEEERTVIVLAYDEELSQAEIAHRLDWPLGTVKTRTRRALGRLRAALAAELGPEPVPIGDQRVAEPVYVRGGGHDGSR